MTTDTTRRTDDAVPEAWPPLTPVELKKFSRPVIFAAVIGTLAIVGAIAISTWISHRDHAAMIEVISRGHR